MNFPRVAIVVLHYKNLADTRQCLRSLRQLDYPDFRIILANNDNLEHGKILRNEFGEFIQFIQNDGNLGFAEGNNVGIRTALADSLVQAVVVLNNDTEVEQNFLSELVKAGGDMTAPKTVDYYDREKIDNLGVVLMESGLPFNRLSESEKLFCPSGGAALYSRRLLEMVGRTTPYPLLGKEGNNSDNPLLFEEGSGVVFDPDFFAYCEDLDLGWRTRLAGFDAQYAKDAVVYHKGSAASGKLSNFAVYHTYRNLIWVIAKNYPLGLLARQSLKIVLGQILLLAFYTYKLRPHLIIKAWLAALFALPKFIPHLSPNTLRKGEGFIKKRPPPKNISIKQIASWFAKGIAPKRYF